MCGRYDNLIGPKAYARLYGVTRQPDWRCSFRYNTALMIRRLRQMAFRIAFLSWAATLLGMSGADADVDRNESAAKIAALFDRSGL